MAMQIDTASAYAQAIKQADRVISGIRPEQVGAATPCPRWNVRELLNHLVGSNIMMRTVGRGGTMGEGISGTEAVGGLGDLIGDAPAAAYRSASAGALSAFTAPGALDQTWKLPFGAMPGAVALNIHLMETVVHTWDLARATSQLTILDPDLADAALSSARMVLQPEVRNEAGDPFGPEVPVAAGAPAYDRLAAFLGREP